MADQVSGRVDIDSVSQYQDTMAHFEHTLDSNLDALSTASMVRERCFARVGFIGNPSDGFNGKTVAFLLGNYWAEVGGSTQLGAARCCSLFKLCSLLFGLCSLLFALCSLLSVRAAE